MPNEFFNRVLEHHPHLTSLSFNAIESLTPVLRPEQSTSSQLESRARLNHGWQLQQLETPAGEMLDELDPPLKPPAQGSGEDSIATSLRMDFPVLRRTSITRLDLCAFGDAFNREGGLNAMLWRNAPRSLKELYHVYLAAGEPGLETRFPGLTHLSLHEPTAAYLLSSVLPRMSTLPLVYLCCYTRVSDTSSTLLRYNRDHFPRFDDYFVSLVGKLWPGMALKRRKRVSDVEEQIEFERRVHN